MQDPVLVEVIQHTRSVKDFELEHDRLVMLGPFPDAVHKAPAGRVLRHHYDVVRDEKCATEKYDLLAPELVQHRNFIRLCRDGVPAKLALSAATCFMVVICLSALRRTSSATRLQCEAMKASNSHGCPALWDNGVRHDTREDTHFPECLSRPRLLNNTPRVSSLAASGVQANTNVEVAGVLRDTCALCKRRTRRLDAAGLL